MRLLSQWLTPALVSALGWTLIHFLWQGLALAVLLRAGLAGLRTPTARYNAAALTLAVMTLAPLVTFGLIYDAPTALEQPALALSGSLLTYAPGVQQAIETARSLSTASAASLAIIIANGLNTEDVSRIFVGFWVVGVLAFSLRSIGGWLVVRELRRKCDEQIAPPLLQTCRRLQHRLGIHRVIRFCTSSSLT